MYGIIDIGSNTIRLLIYEIENKTVIKQILNKKKVVGLARYIDDNKNMSKKGIEKAVEALGHFKTIIERHNTEEVLIFATASLRNINNTEEVVKKIKDDIDMDVTVLTGQEEAFYDFIGATHSIDITDGVIMDIGGGSTELVFLNNGEIAKSVSIPIGSLNTYNKYVSNLIPSKEEAKKIKQVVIGYLDRIELENKTYQAVYGIGGTIRGTCKVSNDMFDLLNENKKIAFTNIKKLLKKFYDKPKQAISELLAVVPDRIHTLVPGMIILKTIMKYYSSEIVILSKFGIREGYLIENIINQSKKKKEIINDTEFNLNEDANKISTKSIQDDK